MSEAPKITMPEPVAWARAWFIAGETPAKVTGASGRPVWAAKFRLKELTPTKIQPDDVPLVPAAQLLAAYRAGMEAAAQIADEFHRRHPLYGHEMVAAAIRRAAEGAIKP